MNKELETLLPKSWPPLGLSDVDRDKWSLEDWKQRAEFLEREGGRMFRGAKALEDLYQNLNKLFCSLLTEALLTKKKASRRETKQPNSNPPTIRRKRGRTTGSALQVIAADAIAVKQKIMLQKGLKINDEFAARLALSQIEKNPIKIKQKSKSVKRYMTEIRRQTNTQLRRRKPPAKLIS